MITQPLTPQKQDGQINENKADKPETETQITKYYNKKTVPDIVIIQFINLINLLFVCFISFVVFV